MYLWQYPYIAVLLETDHTQLHGRILEARSFLEQRLLSPAGDDELCAMLVAASNLDVIEGELSDIVQRIAATRPVTSAPAPNDPTVPNERVSLRPTRDSAAPHPGDRTTQTA